MRRCRFYGDRELAQEVMEMILLSLREGKERDRRRRPRARSVSHEVSAL